MHHHTPHNRVLVIGLDGGTYDVLVPLAERGLLPNLKRLMAESALAVLRSTQPYITPAAWTTFQTGVDVADHGVLDYRYLDHRRGQLLLNHAGRIACPTLFDAVAAAGGAVVSLNLPMTYPPRADAAGIIVGGIESPSIEAALAGQPAFARRLRENATQFDLAPVWRRRPRDFDELHRNVAATRADFRGRAAAATVADDMVDWRLMCVQFQTLDALQHRCWHLLGLDDGRSHQASEVFASQSSQPAAPRVQANAATGNAAVEQPAPPAWTREVHLALRALDDAVGELVELAERRNAAIVVASDHGFGPFRAKISLPELFRRRGLLVAAGRGERIAHRLAGWGLRARKWLRRQRTPGRGTADLRRPPAGVLPLDWKRSTAVCLHGDLGALVYLNTPERFGGPVGSARQRRQAAADCIAALSEARHPETEEPLFADAYSAAERFGFDPLERLWPDVAGIPAAGFHTRTKLDAAPRLVLPDHELTGTHRLEGVLMIRAGGAAIGAGNSAELRDAAPTILHLLGLSPSPHMTGRVLREMFSADATRQPAMPRPHFASPVPAISASEQAVVEARLRDLGYLD